MANLAPVIVTGLSGTDPAQATGFAAAVVLTRVPLLLMGPIQALILPRLTLAAGEGRRVTSAVTPVWASRSSAGLAVLAVAGVALLGHWAVGLLVGAASDTASTTVLILLTVSAMLQMAVQFLQPALVAVRRHRALVIAWVSGGVVFGLAFLVPIAADRPRGARPAGRSGGDLGHRARGVAGGARRIHGRRRASHHQRVTTARSGDGLTMTAGSPVLWRATKRPATDAGWEDSTADGDCHTAARCARAAARPGHP